MMIDDFLQARLQPGAAAAALLLKDCEQFFKPEYALARYCSATCQDAADRWRHWRASQTHVGRRTGRCVGRGGEAAVLRRQRAIDRRIREARFHEPMTLEGFDWVFNAQAIDRMQIETLATGEFIRRGDNLVIAGQSGVGKSRIIQSVGRAACARVTAFATLLRPGICEAQKLSQSLNL